MPDKQDNSAASQPSSPEQVRAYAQYYDDTQLWRKIRTYAQRAGYEVLEKALWLYYAAQKPETPTWARATAFGALGYFILPMDVIPDMLFGIGYTDDLGALTLAVATLVRFIDDDVRRKTTAQLQRWFGPRHNPQDTAAKTEP